MRKAEYLSRCAPEGGQSYGARVDLALPPARAKKYMCYLSVLAVILRDLWLPAVPCPKANRILSLS